MNYLEDEKKRFKEMLQQNEEWLMNAILSYAEKYDFTRYTSTLTEAWRVSIEGLNRSLIALMDQYSEPPEFHPEDDYSKDPASAFGLLEAKLHRSRGVNLAMFLALFKYYRETYHDLLKKEFYQFENPEYFKYYIDRFFDRTEIAYCTEWAGLSSEKQIQELSRTNLAMTNEKNKYLTIFDSFGSPAIVIDKEGFIENMNLEAEKVFRENIVPGGKYYQENKTKEKFHLIDEKINEMIDSNRQEIYFEKAFEEKGFIFDVKISKLHDVSKKFSGYTVLMNDITKIKKAEKALKLANDNLSKSEARLKEAQKIARIGHWELNLVSNELQWSDEIYNIFEIEKYKFGASYEAFLNAIHPEDRDMVNNAYNNSLKDKIDYSIKHRLLMSDGRVKWVKEDCKTSFDPEGNPLASIGTIQDITQQYEKEQLLHEKNKLTALSDLIKNIAHQWRQPLSIITTASSGIKLDKEFNTLTDETIEKACRSIDENAEYLSKTIDVFSDIIKGDIDSKEFNLNNNIEKFLTLVKESIESENINVILELQENITINGRANELTQCFINIFTNAKDALHHIEANKYIFITTTLDKKNNVLISFKDNGGGIPEDIFPKIFEPYFTTEHQSQGKGLGLSMAYNLIVHNMSGTIKAHNVTYEYKGDSYTGAEFTIRLPLN